MAALYLIEPLLFVLVVYFFASQIIVPHINGHQKFPFFRRKPQSGVQKE